ncbi:hypothetical protein J25TS5_24950 [Paenibacillus faecis]|uniref:hypothetical protein n=1 Tax=Paenibacillus faecis TaxID=862114 RepID=UPI001B2EEDC5|nr:hypothetical protein [Paenibacillus faecis]GIO85563.1 hypothetical protein J25TS5_24950 [Paenibacillus faecis]
MKKILSLILTCSFFVYSGLNVSYASSESNAVDTKQSYDQQMVKLENSIKIESKVPLQKITIDPNNSKEVEMTINNYKLLPKTANDIREYSEKVQNGDITSYGISLYLPARSQGNLSTNSTTRTYVGYNHKTYYEDIVVYNSISPETEINKTKKEKWADYAKKTISATVKYYIDKTLDSVTLGNWSMAKIFLEGIPSQVSGQTEITHTAKFIQSVAKKNTYIVLDGQYYFGYASESGSYYWQNFRNIPGYGMIFDESTPVVSKKLPNYDKGDEKAYFNYVNGGLTERFSNYSYGGVIFNAI